MAIRNLPFYGKWLLEGVGLCIKSQDLTDVLTIFGGHLFACIYMCKWFPHYQACLCLFIHVMSKWGLKMVYKQSQLHTIIYIKVIQTPLAKRNKNTCKVIAFMWSPSTICIFSHSYGPMFVIQIIHFVYWMSKSQYIEANYLISP